MKYSYVFYIVLVVIMVFGIVAFGPKSDRADTGIVAEKTREEAKLPEKEVNEESKVVLDVAFMLEAPDGNWTHPWSNACEEAVILMVDKYYAGAKSIGVAEAKAYLQNLFDKEDALFGTNRNTDGAQIVKTIERYANFVPILKINPTLEEIKAEIDAGRPMISLHRGFDLKNPNIEFSPTLSSYHTVVVVGYDDDKKVFITHDPGDKYDGENHEYGYTLFMNSLHDYNASRNKADGPATVIFTRAK